MVVVVVSNEGSIAFAVKARDGPFKLVSSTVINPVCPGQVKLVDDTSTLQSLSVTRLATHSLATAVEAVTAAIEPAPLPQARGAERSAPNTAPAHYWLTASDLAEGYN